jgi:hypothetical protein
VSTPTKFIRELSACRTQRNLNEKNLIIVMSFHVL